MKKTLFRATKGRLYATIAQKEIIDRTLFACNYIYNYMIDRNNKVYQRRGEYLNYQKMQNLLPVMKSYTSWLKGIDSHALKYACRRVDKAYRDYFNHLCNHPTFHSRKRELSYTTTSIKGIKIFDNLIQLPIIGKVKVHGLRKFPMNSKVCSATVNRESDGKYYVIIVYKYEVDITEPDFDKTNFIGLDYVSDGLYVNSMAEGAQMPHYFRESQAKLAKAQRKLAKKQGNQKGQKKSSGWIRQHEKVLKIQKHIANQRKDFLHKESKYIADTFSGCAVENINMRSLSNTKYHNGKATMDNSFGEFRKQLDYKLAEQGKPFIKIDRFYPSSQICCHCGYQNKELKNLQIREWKCPKCDWEHDRDVNAAINICNEGLRMIAKSHVA